MQDCDIETGHAGKGGKGAGEGELSEAELGPGAILYITILLSLLGLRLFMQVSAFGRSTGGSAHLSNKIMVIFLSAICSENETTHVLRE